jgi:hypothetical protein
MIRTAVEIQPHLQPLVDELTVEIRKMISGETMANRINKTRLESTSNPKEAQKNPPLNSGGRFFEIHVIGHLNSKWSDWLDGLEMRLVDNGEMVLFGSIADQAALMGILDKLNRLNLTILSVNPMQKEK